MRRTPATVLIVVLSWAVFWMKDEPFAREEMRRRQRIAVAGNERIEIASAEDTVLQKILWYRLGGGRSDRSGPPAARSRSTAPRAPGAVFARRGRGPRRAGPPARPGGAHRAARAPSPHRPPADPESGPGYE